jgi:eukaryotic-like serine/threonine-protein kinase
MTPSRWQQIEDLYHAALECESNQRAALLARADPELRREVESLLAQQSGATPLDHPAWEGAASLLGSTVAVLTPGTQLGPYKIEGPLAAGGMGEVFRGVDIRLGRSVAVKTSREQFSERFNREARAISSLNHPHICTLYDVGPNYLVMELCQGETLAARLKRGKLSIQETLRYGGQIADALAAAHAKGIVHRDLKPGNVMLSKAGIKVLDFGLARSQQDATLTGSRMVMGTPAYMAPEQRDGKQCDARADIYSLGLVLYEMATGKRAEQNQIPSLDQLPERLQHVIERCLPPDPGDRWQSAQDVKTELEWAGKSRPAIAVERKRRMWLPWGIAALMMLAFVLVVLYLRETRQGLSDERSMRFIVSPPEKVEFSDVALPAISPDGEKLVFGGLGADGKLRLWIRPLSSLAAEPVLGTEGVTSVFWSPDSRSVGFFAGGKLKKSDLNGGPPQVLCDASESYRPGGTWNREGWILFSSNDHEGLYRVPVTGGEPSRVTALSTERQETLHAWPQFLPDGQHFIYLAQSERPENTGIYIGSLDSKVNKLMLRANGNPSYAAFPSGSGYLLSMQTATLMAQAFDPVRLELRGEGFPVAERLLLPPAPAPGFAAFSATENGVLAYRTLGQASTELVWFDRQGRRLGTVGEPANYSVPALSPDEKTLAVTRIDPEIGTRDIWLFDLARGTPSHFTFDPTEETNPTWSPDGTQIVFTSRQKGKGDIYRKAATGAGIAEPLMESRELKIVESWTPDGRFILYDSAGKVWALPLSGDRKPVALLTQDGALRVSSVSPDMRWVAYASNGTGRSEIYVQSFPPSGGKWQVSTTGGEEPYWRRDGKELFYVEGKRLMAVAVTADGPRFQPGTPKPLFEVRQQSFGFRSRYQVAANGQKFLVVVPLESTSPPITVVTNWIAGLKH